MWELIYIVVFRRYVFMMRILLRSHLIGWIMKVFLMREFFMKLGRDCKCVVEATGNWYWLVDLVQGLGLEILLSNPVQTKAIANLG